MHSVSAVLGTLLIAALVFCVRNARKARGELKRRLEAESNLRDAERAHAFVDGPTKDAILVLDRNRVILHASDSIMSILGYAPSELLGTEIYDLLEPETKDLFLTSKGSRSSARGLHFSLPFRHKDGGPRWALVQVDATSEPGTRDVREILLVLRDIGEQQRRASAVREREHELVHTSRIVTLGEIASGIAHELNQPLTAITNHLEASKFSVEQGTEPDRALEDLDAALLQTERAAKIIKNLRRFAQRREPHKSSVDLNEVTGTTLDLLSFEFRRLGARFQVELSPDLPLVVADPVQIQQVLVNLLRNALESMTGTPAAQRRVLIRTTSGRRKWVEVSVSDNGSGIAAEKTDEIFNPFFTTKLEGIGLGLAISRSIVDAHGGALWVDRNSDRGVTFRFTLRTVEAGDAG